jgi:hypothetical protein
MKKEKSTQRFDWSRNPTREGIHSVYISTPGSYTTYGKDITREEMANSLSTWNRINDLNAKKAMFKNLFIAALVSMPFIAIIYNMISTIMQTPK